MLHEFWYVGPLLPQQSYAPASISANCSTAFKWKLCCHWMKGFPQREIALVLFMCLIFHMTSVITIFHISLSLTLCSPEWMPTRILSGLSGMCGMMKLVAASTRSSAMHATSRAWRLPFWEGTPDTTMSERTCKVKICMLIGAPKETFLNKLFVRSLSILMLAIVFEPRLLSSSN